MKQLLLILNPVAGVRKAAKNLADIIAVFNRAGYDTHVYVTEQRYDAVKAVEQFGGQMDRIVCCGGDGTLNETITGLIRTGLEVPVGYIPAGSTNDFANSLGLPGDVCKAAEQIVEGEPRAYDIGRFQDRYFSYVASFGAFTKASYATPQNVKNALGHMAYVLEGITELSTIRKAHIRMETDQGVLEDDYLFGAVCNSTSIGGLLTLNPSLVDLGDGKFEILLVRAPRSIQELTDCAMAVKNQTYDCGVLTFRSAGKIRIEAASDLVWTLDGERYEASRTISIDNLNKRIQLVH